MLVNRKAIALLIIAGSCILIPLLSTFAPAEVAPKPKMEDGADFSHGVMMVYIISSSGITGRVDLQALTDAKLVKLGDRHFLRGKAVMMKGSQSYERYKMLDGTDVGYDWRYIERFYVVPRNVFEEHLTALTAEQ